MGVRWLVCNVRNGTRWLYRGYTWQRLMQSSIQSFKGAPCRAPPKALPEALPEALHKALPEALHEALPEALQKALLEPLHKALPEALYEAPSKLYTELHQSSTRSSIKALHGAPSKPCTELPQSSTRSSLKGAYSSASVAESSGSAGQGAKTSASGQEKTRRYRKIFNF